MAESCRSPIGFYALYDKIYREDILAHAYAQCRSNLMAETPSRKLAVILHADMVGSTRLVQRNESLAHERIRDLFRRFSSSIASYGGVAHEIRGDALVAEFARASDAVSAAVAFQRRSKELNTTIEDEIQPRVRIGISMGEVVIADNTVTGEGVYWPSVWSSLPNQRVSTSRR